MSPGMSTSMRPIDEFRSGGAEPGEDERIPRLETGVRILLSLLFALVGSILEMLLSVTVIFELLIALVTQRPPSVRVRAFANRIVSYYYELGRYLTYNESKIPFPFSDFPEALEEDDWDPEESPLDALGISPCEPELDEGEEGRE